MKIYLANQSKQGLGGGWTFMHNLREGLGLIKADVQFVDNVEDCDIYFISGSSMVTREQVLEAKSKGKKILLRVDNVARNSRNRNTGTTRLYDMGQLADWVVFQSEWAKKKIVPLLDSERNDINGNGLYGQGGRKTFDIKRTSTIINGVNQAIFNPDGDKMEKRVSKRYLIIRFNRDNNKRLEESLDMFTEEWIKDKDIELFIVGQYSRDLVASYFDFYLGEKYQFFGVIENRSQLAGIMRSCDELLYPSYSDACPNAVLEARACGLEIRHNGHAGIPEVMNPDLDISVERMAKEYYNLMKEL